MKANDRTLIVGLATLLLAGGLAACEHGELIKQEPTTAPKQVPLQLTSGILSTVTRAYDSSWETGDKIGVFTVKAGSTNTTDITRSGTYEDANICYKLSDYAGETYYPSTSSYNYLNFNPADKVTIGAQEEDKKIYLPIDGSDVDVYAYYPYDGSATASAKTITLETSQTLAGQKTYDLMSAKALSSTSPINIDHTTAQLLFQHELSKVLIKLVVGTGYEASDLLGKVSIKISGQPIEASFSPLTQSLTITQAANDIFPQTLTSGDVDYDSAVLYTYRALLMPNGTNNPAASDGTRQIVVTVDNTGGASSTYYYTLTETFTKGQQTVFTLRLDPTGLNVSAAITPWSDVSITPSDPLYEE